MQPMIELRQIEKQFVTKKQTVIALKNINLTIQPGDIYGIIGMSGAGKSTLVRCINYLERPTKGEVYIEGQALSMMKNKQLRQVRQQISMIFQHFNLLMQSTVEENIRFPLRIQGVHGKDADERITQLLELVGLKDKAKAYPAQLSGGQKQRVAIARALATNPKILLCDEATSALDPATTKSILRLLKEINQKIGLTIVVITHEMAVVNEICSHVALIDRGVVAEEGTVSQVFTQPKSDTAKQLVYEGMEPGTNLFGESCIRIVFDGNSSFEPVIANMIMECKSSVNILYADTKNIEGKAYGQMILQLPQDEIQQQKIRYYLEQKNLIVEEMEAYVEHADN